MIEYQLGTSSTTGRSIYGIAGNGGFQIRFPVIAQERLVPLPTTGS